MKMTSRIIAPFTFALPLLLMTVADANAGPAARGTLEVTNRASKGVTCRSISYLKDRQKGQYSRMGAWAAAAPGETAKGNKRFSLTKKLGAICYFTQDYAKRPSLSAKNGTGAGLVCRTEHYPQVANSIVTITVYSGMANCTVSQRPGKAVKAARKRRRAR